MTTADSARSQLYFVAESTWGVTPSGPPTLDTLRFAGESLKHNIGTTSSNEIRSDRQILDVIQNDANANGAINFELSYDAYDAFIEAALYSTWGTYHDYTASTIGAAAADNSINDSANSFPAVVPGQWIRISGFTGTTANNGYAQVVSRTVSKIVITNAAAGGITLVDDTEGESVTVEGSMIRNGVTRKSFAIEKVFSDITQFFVYNGMVISELSLEAAAGAIAAGSFGFMGKGATRSGATVGDGSPNSAPTWDVMNCMSNVLNILEGGAASTELISRFSLSLNNNLRNLSAIGTVGAAEIGSGRVMITGNLSVYFQDGDLFDTFVGASATSFSFRMEDGDGNAYVFTLPKIKYTDANIAAGGPDQDVMAELTYQAVMDPTYSNTIQVDKFEP